MASTPEGLNPRRAEALCRLMESVALVVGDPFFRRVMLLDRGRSLGAGRYGFHGAIDVVNTTESLDLDERNIVFEAFAGEVATTLVANRDFGGKVVNEEQVDRVKNGLLGFIRGLAEVKMEQANTSEQN